MVTNLSRDCWPSRWKTVVLCHSSPDKFQFFMHAQHDVLTVMLSQRQRTGTLHYFIGSWMTAATIEDSQYKKENKIEQTKLLFRTFTRKGSDAYCRT